MGKNSILYSIWHIFLNAEITTRPGPAGSTQKATCRESKMCLCVSREKRGGSDPDYSAPPVQSHDKSIIVTFIQNFGENGDRFDELNRTRSPFHSREDA